MATDELVLRASFCEVCRWMWQRGLIGSVEGNLTARLDADRLLITPKGKHKGTLKPNDMVVIDLEGKPLGGGTPSSEVKLHLEVYAQRPDCGAAIHAHPPIATGFALAHETIPDNLLPEAAVFLGSVALVPFAMPGTDATRDAIRPLLDDHKTFLLANHGALVLGTDIYDAFARMETLERVATVVYNSHLIGNPVSLPQRDFQALLENSLSGKLG